MKFLSVLVLGCVFQCHALAAPKYQEARGLYNEFGKTLAASGLWEKKKPPERRAAVVAATAHRERVEKMWGSFHSCSATANWHVNFIVEMNKIVSSGEGVGTLNSFNLISALQAAEQFGNNRAACYDAVEALDAPVKK